MPQLPMTGWHFSFPGPKMIDSDMKTSFPFYRNFNKFHRSLTRLDAETRATQQLLFISHYVQKGKLRGSHSHMTYTFYILHLGYYIFGTKGEISGERFISYYCGIVVFSNIICKVRKREPGKDLKCYKMTVSHLE